MTNTELINASKIMLGSTEAEAMYIGKPVVSTLCLPIIRRMVKDGYNGYTVNVDDHEELANAMVKALELKNFTMIYKSSKAEDFIRLFE